MGRLLDVMERFLVEGGWPCDKEEDRDLLRSALQADNGTYAISIKTLENFGQVLCYVHSQTFIAAERRMDVAEYLTRANFGMHIGNFEMDFGDGEVRFKVALDVDGGELTPSMASSMVVAGCMMMDRYYPGLMAVNEGRQLVLDAIREAET